MCVCETLSRWRWTGEGGEGLFAQQNAFLKLVDFFVMKFQIEVLCVWFLYKKKTKKDNYIMYLLTFFFFRPYRQPQMIMSLKTQLCDHQCDFFISHFLDNSLLLYCMRSCNVCKNTSPESALATRWVYRQKWVSICSERLGDTLPTSQTKRTELFSNVFR